MAANAAFEILYREYYPRVYGLCRRLLNANLSAEDATQEVFMRAYKQFKRYDTSRPFWQWISAICSNYCVDVLRRQTRTDQLFGDEADEAALLADAGSSEPEQSLISTRSNAALLAGIETLEDRYRVPLVLAYFNDASYDEIAQQLQISRTHVGVLLTRARKRLRGELAGDPA